MENNNQKIEEANAAELETLIKIIKDMQKEGGLHTVVLFNRKGRLEIYNGLIDNLFIIASRLQCIATNETNEQLRQARIRQQNIITGQSGRIITN